MGFRMPRATGHPAPDAAAKPRAFCRKCGYALIGLASHRCPECGREFNLAHRRSYAKRPPRRWVWRWARRITALLLLLLLFAGLGLGWLGWGWHSEQATIRQLKQFNAQIQTTEVGPQWLERALGHRLGYLRQRISRLELCNLSAKDMEGIDLQALGHLDELYLFQCDLEAARVDGLGRARALRGLRVTLEDNVRPNLTFLDHLTGLETISLTGFGIDDSALRHVGKLKRLTDINLFQTRVSDRGLDPLRELPGLKNLSIWSAALTDQGLARIGQLPSLRVLTLYGNRISDEAKRNLKKKRPELDVE
jgi:hypothetical protein